jgi:uncharacterized Zn finger protein
MAEQNQTGWMGARFLPHMLSRLPMMPSEVLLRTAAKLSVRLSVAKGRVEAQVEGQTATLKVKPLVDREWKAVLEAVAAQPEPAYRMLSGQFGSEVEEAFAAAGVELFPTLSGLGAFRCSCREPNVCKHICALLVTATVQFDENPFLWLEALGRPRAGLLAALQARMADSAAPRAARAPASPASPASPAAPAPTGGALDPARFWATETDPDTIPVRHGEAGTAPDALLRRLGPLPLPSEQTAVELLVSRTGPRGTTVLTRSARPLDEALREYVRYIGEAAGALATGDLSPCFDPEPLPGKPVHLAERLLPEVAEALRDEGAVLSAEQLAARCPTIGSLPAGKSALPEVLAALPADLVALAGRYAGPRSAVLAGAAFRHVVSYDEHRRGRISADADWGRALQAAGAAPPYRAKVGSPTLDPTGPDFMSALRLQIGDELWLTVADSAGPLLVASPVQREERTPGLDPNGAAAVNALLRHMAATGHKALPDPESAAVLLAEGHYTRREDQDPAWLLPFQIQGIAPAPTGGALTRESGPWQPACAQRPATAWPVSDRETALGWFADSEAARGAGRDEIEAALQAVRWWCSLWHGPQDRVLQVPEVGALLEFLWITAPRHAARHGVQAETVAPALGRWFAVLQARYPELAGAYAEHRAACALGDAHAHRLRTLPGEGSPQNAVLGWIVEGYRWLGTARCIPESAQGTVR